MAMLREERKLLLDLKRICEQVPNFALEFMGGDMPPEAEVAFAHKLVGVAEQLMHHARAKERVVLDGQAAVIEAEPPCRELK